MVEIERKFLVLSREYRQQATSKSVIAQGYLNSAPERTVRIRIKGESGFLTIKGKGSESGMTRFEWETELPLSEAKPLLALCEEGIIEKIRYEVPIGRHVYEVDEFSGRNKGLIIAEIELSDEGEDFEKPAWLGVEVTNDARYYNASLSQRPFEMWNE
ncbi:MAG TPA: CYTH domain-containing protein [Flavobacterium sp.]